MSVDCCPKDPMSQSTALISPESWDEKLKDENVSFEYNVLFACLTLYLTLDLESHHWIYSDKLSWRGSTQLV